MLSLQHPLQELLLQPHADESEDSLLWMEVKRQHVWCLVMEAMLGSRNLKVMWPDGLQGTVSVCWGTLNRRK